MRKYELNTQRFARAVFRRENKGLVYRLGAEHNDQPADTRMAFVEWVDQAVRSGRMSERMAQTITL